MWDRVLSRREGSLPAEVRRGRRPKPFKGGRCGEACARETTTPQGGGVFGGSQVMPGGAPMGAALWVCGLTSIPGWPQEMRMGQKVPLSQLLADSSSETSLLIPTALKLTA